MSEQSESPNPADVPHACSMCGTFIGHGTTDEYCDGCAREVGAKPPLQRCEECGRGAPESHMESIDVSPPDEYYPTFIHLCPGCAGGESDDE